MHRPRIGERIMIEVLPTGGTYSGAVRSWEGSGLVVAPTIRSENLPSAGSAVRITFVRKDGLYEEEGTVTRLIDGPEAQLNLALTGEPVPTQRRDFVRKDTSLNAEMEVRGERTKCVTKDVSGGGVSLLFGEVPPLQEGEEFGIELNVPDGRSPIHAKCRAKYVREVLQGSRWLAGSQFGEIADEDRQRIVRFVFRLELAQKRPR